MKQVSIGIIGTGWCGGIRAETCASSPYVSALHLAEIKPERLKEVAAKTKPATATADYRVLLQNSDIDSVIISATPALELAEADELIDLARTKGLLFTIGYSQRFNPKFAYVKRSIDDGTIGQPVSALVSRHITRNLGNKIGGRIKLSPAAMEATHDIDFVLWCFAPRKPVRVYAQEVRKIMQATHDVPDCVWIIVTLDDGCVFTIGAGWVLPPAYPNFSSTWIEMIGTEGAIMVDDTHRDVSVNTMKRGIEFPISTMPGEKVDHVYAGPMEAETIHFLECVVNGQQPLVTPQHARMVMQVYQAADKSAEEGRPVDLLPTANLSDRPLLRQTESIKKATADRT
jgi:predicted dehydrogenase